MPFVTRKMTDLKEEILAKIDEKFNELKNDFLTEIKEQIKNEVTAAINNEMKKREELESTLSMLQQHVREYQKWINKLDDDGEELGQYGSRLYLRIDGVPSTDKESSDEVLEKVKSLASESECDIPDVVIDRAHRIGKEYRDKRSNLSCKSVIVRFTTFRHRTIFYRNRNKLKKAKVKIDLTKRRYDIYKDAINFVKNYSKVNFVMVDINCRLKVIFTNGKSYFLKNIIDLKECMKMLSNYMFYNYVLC